MKQTKISNNELVIKTSYGKEIPVIQINGIYVETTDCFEEVGLSVIVNTQMSFKEKSPYISKKMSKKDIEERTKIYIDKLPAFVDNVKYDTVYIKTLIYKDEWKRAFDDDKYFPHDDEDKAFDYAVLNQYVVYDRLKALAKIDAENIAKDIASKLKKLKITKKPKNISTEELNIIIQEEINLLKKEILEEVYDSIRRQTASIEREVASIKREKKSSPRRLTKDNVLGR